MHFPTFHKFHLSLKKHYKAVTITSLILILTSAMTVISEDYLGSTSFCTSCHSMTYAYKEVQNTVHYGRLGLDPECADCHLSKNFIDRTTSHLFDGVRNVWREATRDYSTTESYEKYRADMAHTVRMELKKTDSQTCRACHKTVRPQKQRAIELHKDSLSSEYTCIDCHQNIAHNSAPEEDLNEGLKQGKIVPAY